MNHKKRKKKKYLTKKDKGVEWNILWEGVFFQQRAFFLKEATINCMLCLS